MHDLASVISTKNRFFSPAKWQRYQEAYQDEAQRLHAKSCWPLTTKPSPRISSTRAWDVL